MLYASVMNLGGRIKETLEELNWERSELLRRVPNLEPATLSALIVRDSRRSDYAPDIAAALGVQLEWLLTGNGPKHPIHLSGAAHAVSTATGDLTTGPPDPYATLTEQQRLALQLLEGMTASQAAEWLRQGQERERENREVIEELLKRGKGKRVGE